MEPEVYIERDLREKFRRTDRTHSIVAVVGPRQSGKTTFLKKQMEGKDASYVMFDDPEAKALFEEEIKKFDLQYVQGHDVAVLDEIQYCESAGRNLKYLADKGRKLWITSSSETILRKKVLSRLVGRASICRLYPFNLEEFLRAKGQKALNSEIEERLLWEHAVYGGYPKVALTEGKDLKKDILHSLYETILLKDVAQTFSIDDIDALKSLTRYLAHNTGKTVNYQTISNNLDISFKTLKKYLTALEKSYIIDRTDPFHTNKKKEIAKRPKLHFIDNGMLNTLRGSFPDSLTGELFENYVYTELIKGGHKPKFWRTKSKAEVDFVLDKSPPIPIEVKLERKSSDTPKGLRSFISRYEPDIALVVRSSGEEHREEIDSCIVHYTTPYQFHKRLSET
ncbi:MAG: ATP-binding protein [Candidatus Nanohaloarchaea archaeon]|nr:ATP-binding protein [Candidatus Nanohaloarchaea archaeon]